MHSKRKPTRVCNSDPLAWLRNPQLREKFHTQHLQSTEIQKRHQHNQECYHQQQTQYQTYQIRQWNTYIQSKVYGLAAWTDRMDILNEHARLLGLKSYDMKQRDKPDTKIQNTYIRVDRQVASLVLDAESTVLEMVLLDYLKLHANGQLKESLPEVYDELDNGARLTTLAGSCRRSDKHTSYTTPVLDTTTQPVGFHTLRFNVFTPAQSMFEDVSTANSNTIPITLFRYIIDCTPGYQWTWVSPYDNDRTITIDFETSLGDYIVQQYTELCLALTFSYSAFGTACGILPRDLCNLIGSFVFP